MIKKLIFFVLFICCYSLSYSDTQHPQKIVVLLDWVINANHAPLFIAKEKGFFKEQGLDVDLISPANPADPPKLVAAGKADIAITYQPQFLEDVDQGLPLMAIGILIDKPLACLTVLKNSSFQSIQNLKGKQIGYSNGDINSAILKIMLAKHHVKLTDVKLINVNYDLTHALLTKKVDAVIGMMRNVELIQMKLLGKPGFAFLPEEHGVPAYNELIFVAHRTQTNDPKYIKFLAALKKGIEYVQKNPELSWQEFARQHPEVNDEITRQSWLMTIPYFAKSPEKINAAQWQSFAKFMQQSLFKGGKIH